MTKLIYITTIGLLLCSSCITNVAEIRVSSLETLCDHVEALGEIYDKMEEIMGVTLMDAKSEKKFFEIFVKVTENEEEFEALLIKEAEIQISMRTNTFRFNEQLFKDCPKGAKYYPWLNALH